MAIPLVMWGTIANAISATATINVNDALGHATLARALMLEMSTSTSTWAVDIKGAYSADGTYHNISYFVADAAPTAISQAAITVTGTAAYYVVPNPPPFVQVVCTRTGGNLTIKGSFSSEAYSGVGVVAASPAPPSGSTNALTNVTSTAYETSHVLKNAAGRLYSLTGYNSKNGSQFIQLFNSATVPSDTSVPVVTFLVQASSPFSLAYPEYGRYFSTGIAISNSSSGPTKTIGSADCWFDAQVL